MTTVFISYRRETGAGEARALFNDLVAKLGEGSVFMDVDSIALGRDFRSILQATLASCDLMLVLIDKNWAEAKDKQGRSRLNNPKDFVRMEIEAALKRNIAVTPILVQGATIPDADQLPEEIADLAYRNGFEIAHNRWESDVKEMIRRLNIAPSGPPPIQPASGLPSDRVPAEERRELKDGETRLNRTKSAVRQAHWGWIGAIAAGVLMIAYIGVNNFGIPTWWQGSSAGIPIPSASQTTTAEKGQAEQAAKAESNRRQADAEAKRRADEEAARRDPVLLITPGSGQSFRDRLSNGEPCSVCPEMVVAPAETFTMGSPPGEQERGNSEAQVRVAIAQPFAVGKFAVTFDQWDACVADGGCNGYRPADQGWGRGNRPVINVNWDDAKAYAAWLSRKTGKTYRLLSEAEREYVTRAGTTTPFWWGSSISPNQANYNGSAYVGGPKGEDRQRTVPVDSFEANPWGLFNVHGNVVDWTEDCWNDSNQGNPGNGSARATGDCSWRVARGGSWFFPPRLLRAASRVKSTTDHRDNAIGFRLARTLNP
jgi:formylglycine-generating enzyme required for sulfatase activity